MRERRQRLEGHHRNTTHDTLRSKEDCASSKFLLLFLLLAAVTALSKPESLTSKAPTPLHVWYYGWLAAICTGVGALPLLVFSKPSGFTLGLSNAVAAGMMLSASYSLAYEGLELDDDGLILLDVKISHAFRVSAGVMLGIAFVLVTKQMVETWDQFHFGDITGLQASKIILIVAVMTLHSFAEGLGIGVAFCGKGGAHLGAFISMSLAVHNVPEGLAVALVLAPRGVPRFQTLVLAILSSLPQPVIAVPVFLFVENFIAWEPVGLGFAAGAMLWVAVFELILDALKEIPIETCSVSISCSFVAMMAISSWINVST
ncbi:hypothetical protein GUITHDRAFT_152584 [Guillardia theta CCMP2712]|uniref:Uncharacterized protein n=1 Tax=Guillardia theta (strain CCMP2712) TaxID=905079 RepID=L1JCP2_GUITC|nr:hypothetical protein GUITHDRAFT_152584 [Guillardia theta CCMP2712]EKX45865.1 hypothetical protein GUITHDRAFT_152584 [Guillardia theta CCMP2712]|eukprot:XP_005832845.1 hypothetical protein GUITHDRAFT_152584 [Guillardia theta CCMP2712]